MEREIMQIQQLAKPVLLAAILALGGCSTYGGTGTAANTVITVQYGVVQQVQPTTLDASTGKGALLGGLLGLAIAAGDGGSTEAQVAGAAGGALVGGLFQEARKSNNKANQYTIRMNSGGTIAITTEDTGIDDGDCVSVEQGKHANIRRVSSVMCTTVTSPSNPAYPALHQENITEASQCEQAKQELLNSTTAQAVDVANQKMKALCEA